MSANRSALPNVCCYQASIGCSIAIAKARRRIIRPQRTDVCEGLAILCRRISLDEYRVTLFWMAFILTRPMVIRLERAR
jgi:hypothetical protein